MHTEAQCDTVECMNDCFLGAYDAFLIDIDGVLLCEHKPVAGSPAALHRLTKSGRVLLLTNNSTRSRQQHAMRLADAGFDVPAEWILPTSYLAAKYLLDKFGPISTWVLGEAGLREEIGNAGHRFADRPEEAEALVVGMDRHFDYEGLTAAYRALAAGARFIATNEDGTYPVPGGFHPGAGAMVGALRGMGFVPHAVIGKPSPTPYRAALARLDIAPSRVVMIGDRLETDIVGANDMGLATALVLSGVSAAVDVESVGVRPTWIAADLATLVHEEGSALPLS